MNQTPSPQNYKTVLNRHYHQENLTHAIFSALEKAGTDTAALTIDSLGPMEELHIAGRKATMRLGRSAGLRPGMTVLDIGCGIGGPARTLAHFFGCRVIGIDLAEAFCIAAGAITQKMKLTHLVNILHADALALPVKNSALDIVWAQHVTMNIPDKPGLFTEINRVLKPGGKLVLYEILSECSHDLYLPLPFATDSALCFLQSEADLSADVQAAGFHPLVWEDITSSALETQQKVINAIHQKGLPVLNPGILLGPDFVLMAQNLLKNLETGRIQILEAILTC